MTSDRATIVAEQDAVKHLFQTAALLLGSETEAIATVESALAGVVVDPCVDPESSFREAEGLVIRGAIARSVEKDPRAFDPGRLTIESAHCIDTEDLAADDSSTEGLTMMVEGAGRSGLRSWLEELDGASRVVFVLRGILHQPGPVVAALLFEASGEQNWTAKRVGELFRGAVCSLANALAHAPIAA